MYCTGLGDCFLLGFRGEKGKKGETSYVLIDCGVWKGTSGASRWMQQIMQHICDEVGDHGLELLVATHPHWDHLSGFGQARQLFEDLRVQQVWLPWTEDPGDRTAMRMAEERRVALRAAVESARRLRADLERDGGDGGASPSLAAVESLEAVLAFAGYSPPGDAHANEADADLNSLGFAAAEMLGAGPSTDDLMDLVRCKVAKPSYIRPSLQPLRFSHLPNLRIYALGPPLDPKYLRRDDPSAARGKSEVYLAGKPFNEDAALLAALSPAVRLDARELTYPFDRWQRFSREQVLDDPELREFFSTRYLSNPKLDWRRIDTDWLEAANQLALDLDDHVNNASLVLAFELGKDGPVLLFPGDAQVGSWLSWHELEPCGGLSAESLLNRTVLYKVGHHASHNATLKDKGLKMMTETSRLVAMIPVDQQEAGKPKGKNRDGWAMPYAKLLDDLKVRTEGRVLRADTGLTRPAGDEIPGWNEDKRKRERWKRFERETRIEQVKADDDAATRTLFIEYTVRP
ncbi:MAG TPA: hypothetical protein VHQ90_16000 [Thermoanaerobaculia bacterium]|nr:hypothetical protein [Thermoanaerobaculia bacterium]